MSKKSVPFGIILSGSACDDDLDQSISADGHSSRNESSVTESPESFNGSCGSIANSPPSAPACWTSLSNSFSEFNLFGGSSEVVGHESKGIHRRAITRKPRELVSAPTFQCDGVRLVDQRNSDPTPTANPEIHQMFSTNPSIEPRIMSSRVIPDPFGRIQRFDPIAFPLQVNPGFQNVYQMTAAGPQSQFFYPQQAMVHHNQHRFHGPYIGYPIPPPPLYRPRFLTPQSKLHLPNSSFKGCKFCKNNGEAAAEYKSHTLRNPTDGVLICPVLRKHVCQNCGATGDNAHTREYCPHIKIEERLACSIPNSLKKSRHLSNGRLRK